MSKMQMYIVFPGKSKQIILIYLPRFYHSDLIFLKTTEK